MPEPFHSQSGVNQPAPLSLEDGVAEAALRTVTTTAYEPAAGPEVLVSHVPAPEVLVDDDFIAA